MRRLYSKINAVFHQPTARSYRIVEAIVWALIVLSLLPIAAEMVIELDPEQRAILERFDDAILICFIVELSLRVFSFTPPQLEVFSRTRSWRFWTHVSGRLRFCLRPLSLIDLLAVLAIVPALRTLRALRLLRLLRTARLFRYSQPFLSLLRALQENALLYASAFSLLLLTVLAAGTSFYLSERGNPTVNSVTDGLWWALVSITTVGYGDITPTTAVGRLIGSVLMVAGMFTLALFAGIVGSTLLKVVLKLRQEQFRMSSQVNHIVICGYDEGARMLLEALLEEVGSSSEHVIFGSGERPQDLPAEFVWISGDPSKESELDKVRICDASSVIVVGARDRPPQQADATTILVVFTIRSYLKAHPEVADRKRPVYIVAEILDSENVAHARAAGADEVIETTRLGFSLLAHSVTERGSGEIMTTVASAGAHSLYIGKYPFAEPMSFRDLRARLRKRHQITVLGIRDPAREAVTLSPDDALVVDRSAEVIYLSQGPVLKTV